VQPRQGIPIWAESRDGNSQDTEANRDAIDDFCGAFTPDRLREMAWIADSKLVTGPNLARISELGLRFLSRLPETFTAAATAKAAALHGGQWEDLGQIADAPRLGSAHYRASEQSVEIEGRTYRAVVVPSDHLEARKRHTFAKRLTNQREALEKTLQAVSRQRFHCQQDAEAAAGALLQRANRGPFPLQVDISPVVHTLPLGHRGRRRKDEPVQQFVVSGAIGDPDLAQLERQQQM